MLSIDAKPKAKAASSPERVKSSSTPSTPLRTEGPVERPIRLLLLKRIPEKGRVNMTLTRPARLQLTRRVSSAFGSIEGTAHEGNPVSMAIFSAQMRSL